jgi:capsule polysaccharide export protein KpsE/RkpR
MASQIDLSFLRDRPALKRIAAIVLGAAVAGVLYWLVAPKWYRSAVTVVAARSQRPSGGLAALLGSDPGAVAGGLFEGVGGADVQRIAAVLQSVGVADAVIEKFDLRKRYDEKYQETTREALWRHCDVKVLAKPGLVQFSCEDKDPKFVQGMLAYFAEYGNQVFRRVGVSSASEEVRFLEKRVGELREQADAAAVRMRAFQETYHIVDLDTQAKAVVSAIAALNSQQISKELELEYARTFSAREEPSLKQLESQLSVMGHKVRSLEETPAGAPAAADAPAPAKPARKGGMFPPALEVPKLRAEYENLFRDRRVAEATLIFALERLEGAKANEARDTSTFLVLDPPALPTRHARPRGSIVLTIAVVLGLVGALARELLRRPGLLAALTGRGAPVRPIDDRGRGDGAPDDEPRAQSR